MKTAHDLVLAARAGITELTPSQAQAWQATCGALLIDVREPDEFAAGHVPGAVNVPRGRWFCSTPAQARCHRAVNQRCETPACRAALSCQSLASLGYTQLRSVAGGFDQWLAEGLPVEHAALPSFE